LASWCCWYNYGISFITNEHGETDEENYVGWIPGIVHHCSLYVLPVQTSIFQKYAYNLFYDRSISQQRQVGSHKKNMQIPNLPIKTKKFPKIVWHVKKLFGRQTTDVRLTEKSNNFFFFNKSPRTSFIFLFFQHWNQYFLQYFYIKRKLKLLNGKTVFISTKLFTIQIFQFYNLCAPECITIGL
jgi:hypothetical protein